METVNPYIESLFVDYASKGLLIDSNLLLLDLIGSYDPRLIGDGKYNKLSKYTVEDFEILTRLKRVFRRIVTTPHVLTEVSNLTTDLPEVAKINSLKQFLKAFVSVEELTLRSFDLCKRPEFHFLGLTDAGLAHVSDKFLIVTDDARLVGKLHESGSHALNFNHLRGFLFG